jgi:hypothetical protein
LYQRVLASFLLVILGATRGRFIGPSDDRPVAESVAFVRSLLYATMLGLSPTGGAPDRISNFEEIRPLCNP